MQKLTLFKIDKGGNMIFCGYFDSQEEVVQYLEEIKKLIDNKHQHQLGGEYILIPTFTYNITRK